MFLAITKHRCAESRNSDSARMSGAVGYCVAHRPAEAVKKTTHWILARRVSNEIAVMRAFGCALKLVKVIQSSAAHYASACVFVNVRACAIEGKLGKNRVRTRVCLQVTVYVVLLRVCIDEGR